jgi:hypothetical protein
MNNKNEELGLTPSCRKALCVHLGENAGNEIAQILKSLSIQIEELKRTKVNVTHVIPDANQPDPLLAALESESF